MLNELERLRAETLALNIFGNSRLIKFFFFFFVTDIQVEASNTSEQSSNT